MPTPAEQLWESLKTRKFDGVQALIEAHPEADLINSTHLVSGRNLPVDLIQITTGKKDAKPRALLNFVLTHPTLNWSFVNKGQTSVNCLIISAWNDEDYTVIEGLNNTAGFIFNGEKLAYEVALKSFRDAEHRHAQRVKGNKPEAELQESLASVARYKKIVELVRDISILYAIKHDDADLFERLHQSGAKPCESLGSFGNDDFPTFLFGSKQPNPKLRAWVDKTFEQENAERQARTQQALERIDRHRFYQAQADQIKNEHALKAIEITSKAAKEREERIASVIKPNG